MRSAVTAPRPVLVCATLFAVIVLALSWWQWWTFRYATFDLAFYVQALWLALRGQWHVSLLDVPLLGNHAEPIVFLAAPLFAIWPHPMLLVALQTLAMATMPFTAWRVSYRLGIEPLTAALLAIAVVLTPATGFVALHEFHPEALAAPFLLFLIEARLAQRLGRFWLWFVALLACKENLALLLGGWSVVHAIVDRERSWRWQLRWNIQPFLAAFCWFVLYAKVISPALNPGNVDYLELYSHLGKSGPQIVHTIFAEPWRAWNAVFTALKRGNLFWGLLLPFLALPLLRPHWLVIAGPIFLQHLLSWRPSEWSIDAHYAAPLIPLFWIAATETIAKTRLPHISSILVLAACLMGQISMGPLRKMAGELRLAPKRFAERRWKAELLSSISPTASVCAGLPYLSHLATRGELHSLHHVLKGLKTLSRAPYVPPTAPDVVVVDYADTATFSAVSGYYHPTMRTENLRVVPSSDRLLHEFLRGSTWDEQSRNALHTYTRGAAASGFPFEPTRLRIAAATALLAVEIVPSVQDVGCEVRFVLDVAERQIFPWLMLVLTQGNRAESIIKGPCAPTLSEGTAFERWSVRVPEAMSDGVCTFTLLFYDQTSAVWEGAMPPENKRFVFRAIDLGSRKFTDGKLVAP